MASLILVFGGQEQKTFELDKPRMVVGREPSCEIHIDNLGISRQHCAFEVRGEAYMVQDLGSSNGTYVNGRKVSELFLNNDDEVVIGKYTLRFKNEQQNTAPVAKDPDAAVPDTLNTYVMDGAKIQEQLAKMRASATAPGGAPAPTAGGSKMTSPAVGATAKDYAKAFGGAAPVKEGDKTKTLMVVMGVVVVVVIVAFVAVFWMYTHNKP